jgi:hypothetical protein
MPIALGIILVGLGVVALSLFLDKTAGTAAAVAAGDTTAAGSATGVGPNAVSIRNYLQSQGLSKIAAAGVVGNLQQESSLNPNAPGGGLAQWQAPRGPKDWSLSGQLTYLINELKTSYSGLFSQLNAATSPSQAATLFSDQYERPGIPMLGNRIAYANAAYNA